MRAPVKIIALSLLAAAWLAGAAEQSSHPIDLSTVLQLAGAKNLDVQIARERVTEAWANHDSAVNQFFPWVTPSLGYRRHDGQIQDVSGNIFNASKQSYNIGGSVTAQLDLGDAWYKSLATKQTAKAAVHGLEAQRLASTYDAAAGYFDLVKARSAASVAIEALRIARDYADEVDRAAGAGIAFKGDALRVRVQAERNDLALRQAQEQQRVASARLAQVLHLDATVDLIPQETDLVPITLVATNAALDSLVAQALGSRPELKQGRALMFAAIEAKNGAVYGPLVPSLGAQFYLGGLGGGRNGSWGNFGDTEDFFLGVGWRIGPGGLFDKSRIRAAESRANGAQLQADKVYDQVVGQVVEARVRTQSLADQIVIAQRALAAAESTLKLTRARKEFAVGIVLENIQAEQDLTRARNEYLGVVADYNKAQYGLVRALGGPSGK
jgi:outer membrane protein TolC